MTNNFVSVSGVRDRRELAGIARISDSLGADFPIVIGYQVSHKSISTGSQNSRQPSFSSLALLDELTRSAGLTTAIHYYTKDVGMVVDDLGTVVASGVNPEGALVQFNTLPLPIETLSEIKDMGFQTIFKVAVSNKSNEQGGFAVWEGEGVEDVTHGMVEPLIDQVVSRRDFITYAMFDPSHGTNLALDLGENSLAVRFGKSLVSQGDLRHMGLVYAGGITPETIGGIVRFLDARFPGRVSYDIESGIRTDDQLDLGKVEAYLGNYADARRN